MRHCIMSTIHVFTLPHYHPLAQQVSLPTSSSLSLPHAAVIWLLVDKCVAARTVAGINECRYISIYTELRSCVKVEVAVLGSPSQ